MMEFNEIYPLPEICANCHERPATTRWVGEGGSLALSHGFYSGWCNLCVAKKQLEHAEQRAALIPELKAEIARLEAEDVRRP